MAKWQATITIVNIEADDEEQAIEKFKEQIVEDLPFLEVTVERYDRL